MKLFEYMFGSAVASGVHSRQGRNGRGLLNISGLARIIVIAAISVLVARQVSEIYFNHDSPRDYGKTPLAETPAEYNPYVFDSLPGGFSLISRFNGTQLFYSPSRGAYVVSEGVILCYGTGEDCMLRAHIRRMNKNDASEDFSGLMRRGLLRDIIFSDVDPQVYCFKIANAHEGCVYLHRGYEIYLDRDSTGTTDSEFNASVSYYIQRLPPTDKFDLMEDAIVQSSPPPRINGESLLDKSFFSQVVFYSRGSNTTVNGTLFIYGDDDAPKMRAVVMNIDNATISGLYKDLYLSDKISQVRLSKFSDRVYCYIMEGKTLGCVYIHGEYVISLNKFDAGMSDADFGNLTVYYLKKYPPTEDFGFMRNITNSTVPFSYDSGSLPE
jgi:hypothetical protein